MIWTGEQMYDIMWPKRWSSRIDDICSGRPEGALFMILVIKQCPVGQFKLDKSVHPAHAFRNIRDHSLWYYGMHEQDARTYINRTVSHVITDDEYNKQSSFRIVRNGIAHGRLLWGMNSTEYNWINFQSFNLGLSYLLKLTNKWIYWM